MTDKQTVRSYPEGRGDVHGEHRWPETENDIEDGVEVNEAAPHVTPSISPPPVNLRSKPTLPASLPVLPPPVPMWSRPVNWSTTLGVRGRAVPEAHEEGRCALGDACTASDLDHQVEGGQEDEASADEALMNGAQWGHELGEGSRMTSSEESTAVHVPAPARVVSPDHELRSGSQNASGKSASHDSRSGPLRGINQAPYQQRNQQRELTTEQLMTIWREFGMRVVTAATMLFEKSKHALVGDGSYAGFVRAVLAEVPGTVLHPGDEWGYVVYTQTGAAVHRRVSNILPGDVITFVDARLKGQKHLSKYTQTLGNGEPLVGIVGTFNGEKTKVSVWQANQRVGQQANPPIFQRLARRKNGGATQTVENVSYRLEDLKSGQVKVSRCTFLSGLNAELLG